MNVKREDLIFRLESILAGISPREITEQSHCFVFHEGSIRTFNDEIACRVDSPLPPDLSLAIPAEPLLLLLRKMPESELLIEAENGLLVVKGKRRRGGVQGESEVFAGALAAVEDPNPKRWRKLPDTFGEAIALVESCASRDESQFRITCIHVTPTHVEAFDDYQLARYSLELPIKTPFLARRSSLRHVMSLGMTDVNETENWVHFRNATGLHFACRRYLDEFIDLDPHIKRAAGGESLVLPKGLVAGAERASVFSVDSDHKLVAVKMKAGKLKLAGRSPRGYFEELFPVKFSGDACFLIAPELLVKLVGQYQSCHLSGNVLRVDGDNFVYATIVASEKDLERAAAVAAEEDE